MARTHNSPTFGETIKQARIAGRITMQQAADGAGMSKSLLRFWELDEIQNPDPTKIIRLARVLGLEPLQLCEMAGYDLSATLPSLKPYLRSKYPELPADAVLEIAAITRKYGIDPTRPGPAPGEDET